MQLGNEELGTAIFWYLFIWFCLRELSICVRVSLVMCHSAVSAQFIFSSFGSFWSLLFRSSMAKKWPKLAEVLSCVVVSMWVRVLVFGAWAIVMGFFFSSILMFR